MTLPMATFMSADERIGYNCAGHSRRQEHRAGTVPLAVCSGGKGAVRFSLFVSVSSFSSIFVCREIVSLHGQEKETPQDSES